MRSTSDRHCSKSVRASIVERFMYTARPRGAFGAQTLSEAMNTGHLRIEGSPSDVRSFPHWFAWSPMAERVRAASTSQQVARLTCSSQS